MATSFLLWTLWWLFAALRTKAQTLGHSTGPLLPGFCVSCSLSQRAPPSAPQHPCPCPRDILLKSPVSHGLLCPARLHPTKQPSSSTARAAASSLTKPFLPPTVQPSTLPCTPVDTYVMAMHGHSAALPPTTQLPSSTGTTATLTQVQTHTSCMLDKRMGGDHERTITWAVLSFHYILTDLI